MDSIFTDQNAREIKSSEEINFRVKVKGVHCIRISAQVKDEKQLGGTDDEDLRIEIDNQKFPLLKNSERYFDAPAAFSGGETHGKTKIVFFFIWLDTGPHHLSLIPDISAQFARLEVFFIAEGYTLNELKLPLGLTAEDGDRRDWLTFAFVQTTLGSFSLTATLKRRFIDSDDMKITIDDEIKRNLSGLRQKLWYLVASLFSGEKQSASFDIHASSGLHYIEIGADRTPFIEDVRFTDLSFRIPTTIQEKIISRAQQYNFDTKLMLRLAKRESQFDPKVVSIADAKGIFQLTPITIKEIAKLGFKIKDPFDIDQNIEGAFIYFDSLMKRYAGEKDQIRKVLAAWSKGPTVIPKDKPLNWSNLKPETKKLIADVLGDYDF